MGMLWYTREKIAHATIRVVFKLTSKESDSGVFIRITGETYRAVDANQPGL